MDYAVYGYKGVSLIFSVVYKILGKFETYVFCIQGCISLEWKPLNGIQGVK